MTALKMSTNIDRTNKKSLFSVSGLLARTLIYSGICMGMIASLYDFKLNSFVVSSTKSSPAEQYINSIEAQQYISSTPAERDIKSLNYAQEAYYYEYGKFSDSIEKLRIENPTQRDYYTFAILPSIGPLQSHPNQRELPLEPFERAIAIATPPKIHTTHKSYTGVVFAFRNKFSNQLRTKSVICESVRVNLIPPTFDGLQIHCPPGTNILR